MTGSEFLATVASNLWIVIVCGTVVYLVKLLLEHKERQDSRRDKLIQAPLEKFGQDDLAEELAKKYVDQADKADKEEADEPPARPSKAAAAPRPKKVAREAASRAASPININITVNGDGNSIGSHNRRDDGAGRARSGRKSDKSLAIAFFLCLFLGYFGAHYFYCRRPGMGAVYLFTFGLCGVGWLVDLARILCGKFPDDRGRYLA